MTNGKRFIWIAAGLALFCGFLVLAAFLSPAVGRLLAPASTPTIDLFATLSASTPDLEILSTPSASTGEPTFNQPYQTVTLVPPTSSPLPPDSGDEPGGHIVFTCQIYKVQSSDQICIMNADGSGWRRLTTEDNIRHFYPSLSPDGRKVLYSAYRDDNVYEIYAYHLDDGSVDRLTNRSGVLTAPEFSPDGKKIALTRWTVNSGRHQIMTMESNGNNLNNIPRIAGWDPTWSPTGKQILFASDMGGSVQLYVVNLNGKGLHQVSNLPAIRGRSDWSVLEKIVTYSGEPWHRELFIISTDGSEARQLSPGGGNSQGPSFSPDGKWVAFTAYFDHYSDIHGCEIYIIRTDGTDLRRLTDNDYCDYQPRWGP